MTKKPTIIFHCEQELKDRITTKASEMGMTASCYIRYVLLKELQNDTTERKVETKDEYGYYR